jgi:predicted methyltransferase
MNRATLLTAALGALLVASPASSQLARADRTKLEQAVKGSARSAANVARDCYRNPSATLAFFGVRPSHTVVEIFPGGGWYSEIIAPYVLTGGGAYFAAAPDRGLTGFRKLQQARPGIYGKARTAIFPVREIGQQGVPNGSADAVLTFRNVHNWMMGDQPYADLAFRQMFAMLKPGGVLGIEEHRLPESADAALERSSGYVKVSTVRRLAEAAGFRFVSASEINANPSDTKDYPEGVWTLPPTYRLGAKDRERYSAIGESDRMTLKFVKPR